MEVWGDRTPRRWGTILHTTFRSPGCISKDGRSSPARFAPCFLPGSAGILKGTKHSPFGGLLRANRPLNQSSVFALAVWFVSSASQPLSYHVTRQP